MPRAIEIDEYGRTILTDGIAFASPPGKINVSNLSVGDILIWYFPEPSRISALIREFSGGAFSHVGIYSGGGKSIDAGRGGVHESNIKIPEGAYAHVFRVEELSHQNESEVIERARALIGYDYAWLDAITLPARRANYYLNYFPRKTRFNFLRWRRWVGLLGGILNFLRKRFPPKNKIFCSQIIAEAYGAIGYIRDDLVKSGIFTPNDLAVTNFATRLGWISMENNPNWHPFDPYSPEPVINRTWRLSIKRIFTGHSTDGE